MWITALAAVVCVQVTYTLGYEINLPEWRRTRVDFDQDNADTSNGNEDFKELNAGFRKCCQHFGVPEGLAYVSCRYRDFESLAWIPAWGDKKRDDIESTLAKCNLVQHWPYTSQISYCMHDSEELAQCIRDKGHPEGKEYPDVCSEAFGTGKSMSIDELRTNAKNYIDCFDFTKQMIECSKEKIVARGKDADGETHYKYLTDANAPPSVEAEFQNEGESVCSLSSGGKNIRRERKLYLSICKAAEAKEYGRFRKTYSGAEQVTFSEYFYHTNNCPKENNGGGKGQGK